MVHHDGIDDHIECLIRKRDTLYYAALEINGQAEPSRFIAGAGDLLCAGIDAEDPTCRANTLLNFNCQCSCATAHIQHLLTGPKASQVSGSEAKFPQFALKQKRVAKPLEQVVA